MRDLAAGEAVALREWQCMKRPSWGSPAARRAVRHAAADPDALRDAPVHGRAQAAHQ